MRITIYSSRSIGTDTSESGLASAHVFFDSLIADQVGFGEDAETNTRRLRRGYGEPRRRVRYPEVALR